MSPSEVTIIVTTVIETLRQVGLLTNSSSVASVVQAVTNTALSTTPLPQAAAPPAQGRAELLAALRRHAGDDGTVDLRLVAADLGITRRAVLMRIDAAEQHGELVYVPGEAGKCGQVRFTSRGSGGSGGSHPTSTPSTPSTQNGSGASKTPKAVEAVEAVEASTPSTPSTGSSCALSLSASALSSELNSAQREKAQGQRTSALPRQTTTAISEADGPQVLAVLGEGMDAERARLAREVRTRLNTEQLSQACQRWAREGGRLARAVRTSAGDRRMVEGVSTGGSRAAWDADFAGRIAHAGVQPARLAIAIARADACGAQNSLGYVAACLGLTGSKQQMQLQISEQGKVEHWERREREAVEQAVVSSRMLRVAKQVEAKAKAGGGA